MKIRKTIEGSSYVITDVSSEEKTILDNIFSFYIVSDDPCKMDDDGEYLVYDYEWKKLEPVIRDIGGLEVVY